MRTRNTQKTEASGVHVTALTQKTAEPEKDAKFPKSVRSSGRVLAATCVKSQSHPAYRVAWTAASRRMMDAFRTCSQARRQADDLAKQLRQGLPSRRPEHWPSS